MILMLSFCRKEMGTEWGQEITKAGYEYWVNLSEDLQDKFVECIERVRGPAEDEGGAIEEPKETVSAPAEPETAEDAPPAKSDDEMYAEERCSEKGKAGDSGCIDTEMEKIKH